MDIVNRLKFFLDQQGLTSSQFADACRIPRPTLSQLLTGRNKKVSDEIFAKIHDAFPQLSILWLMFGEGQPFAGSPSAAKGEQSSPAGGAGDFSAMVSNGVTEMPGTSSGISSPGMIDFGNSLFDSDTNEFGVEQSAAIGTSPASTHPLSQLGATASNTPGSSSAPAAAEIPQGKGTISINPDANKKITSIVVFYNDNSFQSFAPTA